MSHVQVLTVVLSFNPIEPDMLCAVPRAGMISVLFSKLNAALWHLCALFGDTCGGMISVLFTKLDATTVSLVHARSYAMIFAVAWLPPVISHTFCCALVH